MRFEEFMREQQITRRTRLSAEYRARAATRKQDGEPRRNGHVPTTPPPEAIVTRAKQTRCEPTEFEPPRPADEEFCARVEDEIAEARRRCQEIIQLS